MAIAANLQQYLDAHGVDYELIPHPYSASSMATAEAAHVPGSQLAKSVVVEDDRGYVVAVLPATHKLDLEMLHNALSRPVHLASEEELESLFSDCELGAIPPVGQAYGVDVVLDDSLLGQPDIYFEAGDHTELVHVRGDDFQALLSPAKHGHFSHRV